MNRRIFKPNRTTPYLEYFVLTMDPKMLQWKQYFFGFLVSETHCRIESFQRHYPNYLDLKADLFFNLVPFPEATVQPETEWDAAYENASWNAQSRTIRSDLKGCKEITAYAVYHPLFGILEEYGGVYQTQMVVPFLNEILEVFIEGMSAGEAAIQYKALKIKYLELRPHILHSIYECLKALERMDPFEFESRRREERFAIVDSVDAIEDWIRPRNLSIATNGITIEFECDWDEEHSISVQIQPDWKINLL